MVIDSARPMRLVRRWSAICPLLRLDRPTGCGSSSIPAFLVAAPRWSSRASTAWSGHTCGLVVLGAAAGSYWLLFSRAMLGLCKAICQEYGDCDFMLCLPLLVLLADQPRGISSVLVPVPVRAPFQSIPSRPPCKHYDGPPRAKPKTTLTRAVFAVEKMAEVR